MSETSALTLARTNGGIIPYDDAPFIPYDDNPLAGEIAGRLATYGIQSADIALEISTLFQEMSTASFPATPSPKRLSEGYKVMAFDREDTISFYLYPEKSGVKTSGMSKKMSDAFRVVISKEDGGRLIPASEDKIIRLYADLSDTSQYPGREAAFRHEARLLERVSGDPRFTQQLDWTIYTGSKTGQQYPKGVMFQQYYPNGTLDDRLANNRTEGLFQELLNCLVAMEEQGIIQSDPSPANILFDKDDRAVIADLEFALAQEDANDPNLVRKYLARGIPGLMAPEKVRAAAEGETLQQGNIKSNVWSFGCILHYIHYNRWPEEVLMLQDYAQSNNRPSKTALNEIVEAHDNRAKQTDQIASVDSIDNLISRMLHPDPSKRISAGEALTLIGSLH